MQVTVETEGSLGRRLVVSVPGENLEAQLNSKLRDAARSVRLAGFRPGKVPVREVRRRFGAELRAEAASELVQQGLIDALGQEDLVPCGTPQVEVLNLEPGADLRFAATFEVFPKVELADFSSLEIERPVVEITEQDIDRMAEELRERRKTYVPVERPAAEGDQVEIDFSGSIEGEEIPGGRAEKTPLVLGSGAMIDGFESGLVGARAGDDRTLELTFPEDYQNKDLAGKTALFKVHVNSVSDPQLPELNEEFFKSMGVEDGTEASFRRELAETMQREAERAARLRVTRQVSEWIVERHADLPIPEAAVKSELHNMEHALAARLGISDPHGLPEGFFDGESEVVRGEAERRVRLALVMAEVKRAFEVEPDGGRVRKRVEEIAAGYQQPEEMVRYIYSDDEHLGPIENAVLEEQLIEAIVERARVTDVPASYASVVGGDADAASGGETADATGGR